MSRFPYKLTPSEATTLGLIVLKTDETIEQEFRRYFANDAARLFVTRIPSGDTVTPDSLTKMREDLPAAADLFPTGVTFDAVGYGCTSGATMIGADAVSDLVQSAVTARAVTNPLTAGLAAAKALGLGRMGIVSPYVASVAEPLRRAFEMGGLEVPEALSFGEEVEAKVAHIAPSSIAEAARALAQRAQLDGIFLSCTNLQTIDVIDALEAELGIPILSSNQVLAWHMGRLSVRATQPQPIGRLFRLD